MQIVRSALIFGLAALGFFFILPDRFYDVYGSGLDPSWRLALHIAFEQKLTWGREFVFTYGPLGILATRFPFPGMRPLLAVSDLFLFGGAVWIVLWMTRGIDTVWQGLVLAGVLFCLGWSLHLTDYPIMLLMFELFFLYRYIESRQILHLTLSAAASVLSFLVKLNVGLVSGIILLIAFLAGEFCPRPGSLPVDRTWQKRALKTVTGFMLFAGLVLTSLALAAILPFDFLPYLRSSWEIAAGYNDGMSVRMPERTNLVVLAVILLLAVLATGLRHLKLYRAEPANLARLILASAVLFVLFKQGFVRGDGHEVTFFSFAPVTLGILWRFADGPLKRDVGSLVILSLLFVFPHYFDRVSPEFAASQYDGLHRYVEELRMAEVEVANPDPLNESEIQRLRGSTVDVIPWNSAFLHYNGLEYRPRPVMQSYSAYTPFLDRLNAGHFESEAAPDIVLFDLDCVDHRYCFADESLTKQVLYRRYRVEGGFRKGLLLGKNRPGEDRVLTTGELFSSTVPLKRPIHPLLRPGALRYGQWKIEYTLLGKLAAFLYRAPELRLVFKLTDGRRIERRAVRQILAGGIPISHAIFTIEEAEQFFKGEWERLPQVAALSIYSPQSWAVKRDAVLSTYWISQGAGHTDLP